MDIAEPIVAIARIGFMGDRIDRRV